MVFVWMVVVWRRLQALIIGVARQGPVVIVIRMARANMGHANAGQWLLDTAAMETLDHSAAAERRCHHR